MPTPGFMRIHFPTTTSKLPVSVSVSVGNFHAIMMQHSYSSKLHISHKILVSFFTGWELLHVKKNHLFRKSQCICQCRSVQSSFTWTLTENFYAAEEVCIWLECLHFERFENRLECPFFMFYSIHYTKKKEKKRKKIKWNT